MNHDSNQRTNPPTKRAVTHEGHIPSLMAIHSATRGGRRPVILFEKAPSTKSDAFLVNYPIYYNCLIKYYTV
ncbi:hypothetical protein L484_024286 [Morus notabilis]|uniref:Uncharacterized protein n=1 Tax=Morus notabilis TaxID=981085 RepID=W9QHD6_9ROSA|nr:hypothetical protein L484_024286 [Morus notabilis]